MTCLSPPPNRLHILYSLLIFIGCLILAEHSSAQNQITGVGHIDSILVDGKHISAQGWAATQNPDEQIDAIDIFLQGTNVYTGTFERFQRPDVANGLNRADWMGSGWQVSFNLPEEMGTGTYDVTASARTRNGEQIVLTPSSAAARLFITPAYKDEKNLVSGVKLTMAGAFIFLALFFMQSSPLTHRVNRCLKTNLSEPFLFSTAVVMVGLLFVGIGLTGSSLKLGQPYAPFVQIDGLNIVGHNQTVRTDEWLVLTPFAIAQYNHEPQFPVVNTHSGEDGQNMMVMGMTGVPVKHITALVKPATWGFFISDLRRALSWDWYFPIVGCFLALAFVLNRLSDEHWKQGFLFSGLFCCAPYVVAWSYWPAYAVFFPCVMLLSTLQILTTSSVYKLLSLGALLGMATAGFVLILYPPWQVPVGYVFIALTTGVVLRDKLYRRLTFKGTMTYTFAIGVAGAIVMAWWSDASPAIHSMTQTIYPGQRVTVGGTANLSLLLRGFTNLSTLHQLNSTVSNQSEMASFYYLLLPLATLIALRGVQKRLTVLEWSLTGVTIFLLIYMFFGLYFSFAKYSLLGHSAPYRVELALGLATLTLTFILLTKKHLSAAEPWTVSVIALVISMTWSYIIYRSIWQLDSSLTAGLQSSTLTFILLITTAISYCLMTHQLRPFIFMSIGLSMATTINFHPVNIAPNEVRLLSPSVTSDTLNFTLKNKRVIVLEHLQNTRTPPFLIASGISVINGVHYFPQKTLWSRLDATGKQRDVYNRYQHLAFVGVPHPAENYVITTPFPDIVTVRVNIETFDFRLSGANVVLAPDIDRSGLNENKSLGYAGAGMGWSWFNVKEF